MQETGAALEPIQHTQPRPLRDTNAKRSRDPKYSTVISHSCSLIASLIPYRLLPRHWAEFFSVAAAIYSCAKHGFRNRAWYAVCQYPVLTHSSLTSRVSFIAQSKACMAWGATDPLKVSQFHVLR